MKQYISYISIPVVGAIFVCYGIQKSDERFIFFCSVFSLSNKNDRINCHFNSMSRKHCKSFFLNYVWLLLLNRNIFCDLQRQIRNIQPFWDISNHLAFCVFISLKCRYAKYKGLSVNKWSYPIVIINNIEVLNT